MVWTGVKAGLTGGSSRSRARQLRVSGLVTLLTGALAAGVLSPGPAFATGAITGPNPYLEDVSCSSNSLCVAVGNQERVVTSTNPTLVTPTWIAEDIDADGPGFMTAVSCVSTALCVAVDLNSRIPISTDPADATPTWSAPAYIGELGLIETISCPSTSLCVAVDNYGRAVISTDPTAALPTWSVTDIDSVSPQPFTAHPYEVSCSSASLCVAVNNRGHAVISTDPAAVTPTWRAPATVDNTALTDIACPSTSLCVGIDEAGRAVISTDPTVPMPTWSAPTTVDNSALIGISCPTTSLCVALDKADRTVISTNPTSATPKWHVVTTPASVKPGREGFEELPQRISCASTSLCVITGSGTAMISTDLGSAAPTWSAPTDIDPRGAGATSGRVRKFCGSCGEGEGLGFVTGDLLDHVVELGAGEGPLEWSRECAVVLGEVHQVSGELGQCRVVVGCQGLALHDREVDLDLAAWPNRCASLDRAGHTIWLTRRGPRVGTTFDSARADRVRLTDKKSGSAALRLARRRRKTVSGGNRHAVAPGGLGRI